MFKYRILSILQKINSLYVELNKLCAEKREAILSEDNEKIIAIINQEEKIVAEIDSCEKDRRAAITELSSTNGFPVSLGIGELLARGVFGEMTETIEKIRKSILDVMAGVKRQNEENLMLIESSKSIIEATLDFIKSKLFAQQAQPKGPGTYTRQGVMAKSGVYKSPQPVGQQPPQPSADKRLFDFVV